MAPVLALLLGACLAPPACASSGGGEPVLFGVMDPHGHLVADTYFESEVEAQAEVARRNAELGEGHEGELYTLYPLTLDAEHGKSALFVAEPGIGIWLLLTFILIFLLLRKYAWPAIMAGLEARERGIVEAVQAAERSQAEAKALLEQYEAKLATARDEVQAIIDEGKRDATKVKDDIVQQGWKNAEEIKGRARREMELEAGRVTKDIYTEMAALATTIASRIIERELDEQEHERLVTEALEQYAQTSTR